MTGNVEQYPVVIIRAGNAADQEPKAAALVTGEFIPERTGGCGTDRTKGLGHIRAGAINHLVLVKDGGTANGDRIGGRHPGQGTRLRISA